MMSVSVCLCVHRKRSTRERQKKHPGVVYNRVKPEKLIFFSLSRLPVGERETVHLNRHDERRQRLKGNAVFYFASSGKKESRETGKVRKNEQPNRCGGGKCNVNCKTGYSTGKYGHIRIRCRMLRS